jgi:hypothetical protein
MTTEETGKRSLKFRIGVFFLVFNIPLGLVGWIIAASLAVTSPHKAFWAGFGIAVYAISWGMLGLGVLMAGKEGMALAREFTRKLLRRKP